MDSNTSILQSGSSERAFHGFHLLKRVERDPVDGDRLKWLWERVCTQDYAFDDFSRGRVDWFLFMLADPHSTFLEIGDVGMFMLNLPVRPDATSGGTASVHFVIWDRNFSLSNKREYLYEMLDYLFYEVKVHRVTGMIPTYNKLAARFCLSIGMKYEGEMRECVLWKGLYHNVQIYGLLEKEYQARKERLTDK